MFNTEIGSQVAWLLPAALILGVGRPVVRAAAAAPTACAPGSRSGCGWLRRHRPDVQPDGRASSTRTTPSPSPPRSPRCVGIGAHVLWRHRDSQLARRRCWPRRPRSPRRWTFELLGRDGLAALAAVRRRSSVGFAAAARCSSGSRAPAAPRRRRPSPRRRIVAALAGPAAYSLATAATPHTGSIPSAGPVGGRRGRPRRRSDGQLPPGGRAATGGGASTGGLLDGSTSSDALNALLERGRVVVHLGGRGRRAPTGRRATSWRPSCR